MSEDVATFELFRFGFFDLLFLHVVLGSMICLMAKKLELVLLIFTIFADVEHSLCFGVTSLQRFLRDQSWQECKMSSRCKGLITCLACFIHLCGLNEVLELLSKNSYGQKLTGFNLWRLFHVMIDQISRQQLLCFFHILFRPIDFQVQCFYNVQELLEGKISLFFHSGNTLTLTILVSRIAFAH